MSMYESSILLKLIQNHLRKNMSFKVKDINNRSYDVVVDNTAITIGSTKFDIDLRLSLEAFSVKNDAVVKRIIIGSFEIFLIGSSGNIINKFIICPRGPKKITYLVPRMQNGYYSSGELSLFFERPLFDMDIGNKYWFSMTANPAIQIEATVKSLLVSADKIEFNINCEYPISLILNEITKEVCYIKNLLCYDVVHYC